MRVKINIDHLTRMMENVSQNVDWQDDRTNGKSIDRIRTEYLKRVTLRREEMGRTPKYWVGSFGPNILE